MSFGTRIEVPPSPTRYGTFLRREIDEEHLILLRERPEREPRRQDDDDARPHEKADPTPAVPLLPDLCQGRHGSVLYLHFHDFLVRLERVVAHLHEQLER